MSSGYPGFTLTSIEGIATVPRRRRSPWHGTGHRYGVDHGLTFHQDHKLRTVLWGWIGEELSAEELEGIDRIHSGLDGELDGELGAQLAKLLTAEEIEAFAARCARLRSSGVFPAPSGQMPAVPWPLF